MILIYKMHTLKDISHLANLSKRGSIGPSIDHIHQVRFKLVQVGLLIHFQLGIS